MSKKPAATSADIDRFLSLIYPGGVALAKVSFSKKKVLNDASDLIESLESQLKEVKHYLKLQEQDNDRIIQCLKIAHESIKQKLAAVEKEQDELKCLIQEFIGSKAIADKIILPFCDAQNKSSLRDLSRLYKGLSDDLPEDLESNYDSLLDNNTELIEENKKLEAENTKLKADLVICDEVDDDTQLALNHLEKLENEKDWRDLKFAELEAENIKLKEREDICKKFAEELDKNMVQMPPEFNAVINKHFWELLT